MDSRILFLFAILIRAIPYLSADNKNYTKCGQLFQCGNQKNIGYPFFGDSRPDYCGHPRFHLTNCQSNSSPIIEINSFNYRIKSIESDAHIIKLVRDDYLTTVCPQFLYNASVESGPHFSYESGTSDLVLYYNCSRSAGTLAQPNQFRCFANASFIEAYYAMSGVELREGVTCATNVSVQVERDALVNINTASFNVTKSVLDGFGVMWDANNDECEKCVGKGGWCGSDPGSGLFQCYGRGSSSGNQLLLAIPIVGAVLSLLGIGLAIFVYKKRRNHVNSVQSSQFDSKDNAFSSISKGLTFTTTPSVNLSQSVPSYASSKLESSKSSSYFGVQMFTYTELEEATNNFDISRELGEGGFGTVYFGKLKDDRIVAVKRLYENNYKRIEQFMNELDILTRLRHDNLVMLYGCTSRRSRELLLVYEYVPNGTVADHLYGSNSHSTASLSWPTRLKIAIETADALAYLHESDIIHRDVKTNNILLDNDFKVKVADFGLSRLFPTDVTHVSTAPQGTPGYVDPEYHNCYHLTEKSDVYSFGVVLIELISSKQAVDTNRNRLDINLANMAINRIQNGALHDLVDPFIGFETDSLVRRKITLVAELAFRCLQMERDMRPSMDEVVKSLRGIKNGNLGSQQEEVVEIVIEDDVALLKGRSTPVSPRSPVTEKQARNLSVRYSSD